MCPPTKQAAYPHLAEESSRAVRPIPIRSIQEKRIHEFVGGQFSEYNLSSLLYLHRTSQPEHIRVESWSPPSGERPTFQVATQQSFSPCQVGAKFGPSWSNHWLKLTLNVPPEWRDLESIELDFDASCEALIFDPHGNPLQGLTGGLEFDKRHDFPIPNKMRSGTAILFVEITGNGMFGIHGKNTRYYDLGIGSDPDPDRYFELAKLDLVAKRKEAWDLLYDFVTLHQCVEELPKDSILQNKALWLTNEIMNTFRKADTSSIQRCRVLAEEVYGEAWSSNATDLFKGDADVKSSQNKALIWSLGHCHIDCVWLWSFSQAQQKVARSWSTQLALMDRYPEYTFTASSPQQFKWVETLYPKLFERIKEKVREGRFQPIGGLWVECDANMPSGESFCRQLLYGQRYLQSRFGIKSNVFFLPDSFGYNSQIPQLARQSGCDYFFTQKLCWNRTNTFPHCTMMWTGLDGTQVVFSQSSIPNYNSRCGVNDLIKGVRRNPDLGVQPSCLHLFGFGDGGGGANAEHLERLRRARAISNNGYGEIPKVTVGRSAKDFFEHVLETTKQGERLATWKGEVYLEFHRGVYTSQASMKRWNRLVESNLHDLEWLCTLAAIRCPSWYKYPHAELQEIWEPFMLGQFHDCLPGSSIRKVYDDMERTFVQITQQMDVLRQDAFKALSRLNSAVQGENPSVVNTLGLPRRELLEVEKPDVASSVSSHAVQDLDGQKALVVLEDKDGEGTMLLSKQVDLREGHGVQAKQDGEVTLLESSDLRVRFEGGRITSIYEKVTQREILQRGQSAGFSISEDYPPEFDNWEVEVYSLDTVEQIHFDSVSVEQNGPWRAGVRAKMSFGQSTLSVLMYVDAVPLIPTLSSGARPKTSIHFRVQADWHEKHRFLRFQVPTSIRSDQASYEMQFGYVQRPTSRNTTWEAAKFEVCGHRFADLSEPNYGLAILTQNKYGYSVEGSLMRLSLLKAGTYPDSQMDQGLHEFEFALYPHSGNLIDGDVVNAARVFNARPAMQSLLRLGGEGQGGDFSCPLAVISDPEDRYSNVILDTIKMAEPTLVVGGGGVEDTHQKRAVICRLYESIGTQSKVQLRVKLPFVARISVTNLLEETLPEETAQLEQYLANGALTVKLQFRPFEFKTLRLDLDD